MSGDEGLERVLPKTFPKMRAGPDVEPLRLRADRMVNDLRGRGSRSSYADPADLYPTPSRPVDVARLASLLLELKVSTWPVQMHI